MRQCSPAVVLGTALCPGSGVSPAFASFPLSDYRFFLIAAGLVTINLYYDSSRFSLACRAMEGGCGPRGKRETDGGRLFRGHVRTMIACSSRSGRRGARERKDGQPNRFLIAGDVDLSQPAGSQHACPPGLHTARILFQRSGPILRRGI